MRSMTGFGRSNQHMEDLSLDVSVRSVNGRFLELKIHGPKIYNPLLTEIRKRVLKKIKRGNVEVFIVRRGGEEEVSFNQKLAGKWLKGFHQVVAKLGLEPIKNSQALLQIPDFFRVEDGSTIRRTEKAALCKAMDQALDGCLKAKNREGGELKKDLQNHLKGLLKQLGLIRKLKKQTLRDLEQKYKNRLKRLGLPAEVDSQRLAQEIVIQVDKSDISEEIQRLEVHIQSIKALLSSSDSIGRKLDFYAQELLRELNTIGSKSSDSKLTDSVVESKVLVEKYREQVQNVE